MAIHRQAPEFRPWVEQVAGLIGDPVRRLRFLRAVAPVVQTRTSRSRPHSRTLVISLLLCATAGAALFWLARAAIRF
ncbi:MAG TPA: hypothetical protein VMA31_18425 [Bryobacteraceae bacterium]|nr:hypothetical protein [Bryobacteraceae bacterium]